MSIVPKFAIWRTIAAIIPTNEVVTKRGNAMTKFSELGEVASIDVTIFRAEVIYVYVIEAMLLILAILRNVWMLMSARLLDIIAHKSVRT